MAVTIAQPVHAELIIRKSRFIGRVQPVQDRLQAADTVAMLRREHPAATHVCWALLAGGDSAANDDGEPGGTAGRPMLDVLRKQELDGVLATVVRYFGGIKLGAGGLVRAYAGTVAQALRQAEKIAIERWVTQCCTLPYDLEGTVRRALDDGGARALEVRHAAEVHLRFQINATQRHALRERLADLARGRISWAPDTTD